MENIFELTKDESKEIADKLQERIEEGLQADKLELSCIPTHIHPKEQIEDGKVLTLDWGGTNFRAAIVEYKNGKASVIEDNKILLDKDVTKDFNQAKLFEKMAGCISNLKHLDESVTKIGYCFSYPAASRLNGDAILLRWTKGICIVDMPGEEAEKGHPNNIVGEPLMKYLNNRKDIINTTFNEIKVLNDTVACLFAGLTELTDAKKPFDSYIGLIVGTGTNMASLMQLDKIEKLNNKEIVKIPVNLESGNFNPPYLTVVDGLVDVMSNNKGRQRFEKAISGGYLGELFKTVFMDERIKSKKEKKAKEDIFDGEDLSDILTHPEKNSKEHADAAKWICERSAKLVAASIAGLVQTLLKQDPNTKKIGLAADGSVFWKTPAYKNLVESELKILLPSDIEVTTLPIISNPNLIGSAIAALS